MSEYKHTFAICAYKESPYLEECICSLKEQSIPSKIILATSTPCAFIEDLCRKYDIPCYVNYGEHGITQDWNFAYAQCDTPIVTIAHQDDIYFKDYTSSMFAMLEKSRQPLIYFSEYAELRNGELVFNQGILRIKRLMLFPLRFKVFWRSRWMRRRILSLGCPICCPSVTFFRDNLKGFAFKNHFRTNEDWEAWEIISRYKGEFLYDKNPQMAHRIHADSETSATIKETGRTQEDIEMYRKFWPAWIARLLAGFYKKSEQSNDL